MADDARQPGADLRAPADGAAMDFFTLLARLEADGRRFGCAGGPADEPARLGQAPRLAFATGDVAAVAAATGDAPPRVEVTAIGLLGPEGPMPLHMTSWVLRRLSQRWFEAGGDRATADTAFLDFCNLLQHRMIALFWRAWADARPGLALARDGSGRLPSMLAALAGLGLPGMRGTAAADALAPLAVAQATTLAIGVNAPDRLTGFLGAMLDAPVRLVELVGEWIDLPPALQTRLGRDHAGLGTAAVVGRRSFQRQMRAELRIGPLPLSRFLALADSPELKAQVAHAVRFVAGTEIGFDLRLVLAGAEVPPPRLGACRLGRTSWLSRAPTADRYDLRMARLAHDPSRRAA